MMTQTSTGSYPRLHEGGTMGTVPQLHSNLSAQYGLTNVRFMFPYIYIYTYIYIYIYMYKYIHIAAALYSL